MDELDIGLSKKSKIIEIGSVKKKLWIFKVGGISKKKTYGGGQLPPILLQPIVPCSEIGLCLEVFRGGFFQFWCKVECKPEY